VDVAAVFVHVSKQESEWAGMLTGARYRWV